MPRPKRSEQARKHPQKALAVRPFWSGTLSFGLVSIPVDFYPADRPGGAHLRWLSSDGVPLSRRYFCPAHDAEVSDEHLVRGYELDDGKYVVVSDEELKALDPEKSSDIALQLFVDAHSIDPLYFERGYFLGFSSGSAKAYRLLAEVMQRTQRAGIATFVLRDKQHVVAIFAEHGVLSAQTLRFHDEVRGAEELELATSPALTPGSVERMTRAVDKLSADAIDPSELQDVASARLLALARAKAQSGKDLVELQDLELEDTEQVVDLMKLLKRSLSGEPSTQAEATEPEPAPRKRTPHKAGTRARRAATRSSSRRHASSR